ncbi:PHP domain-containing protein [Amphibacillus marinus]|uniref:PHP domain-containing protein n=1 Tax=Amphibacillus marinus TaxID=872970 RepID=A0A1H8JVH2_9BACI|nr:CehA/McbA family metallohydrolase [Amphibacillus marinus]SEN84208.1 PHP domain-containing protein [Amphibacillus marinus]
MQTIFETTTTLEQSSTQSHSSFTFFVPMESNQVMISFAFSPAFLDDNNQAKQIISQALDHYQGWVEAETEANQINKHLPIKNLLTLSVDDPNGFRGARHCHKATQLVTLSEQSASPGMLKGSLPEGLWAITISAHALVTETCTFKLKVEVEGRNQTPSSMLYSPWQHSLTIDEIPLNQIDQHASSTSQVAKKWLRSELHVHTNHSDGRQSLTEIVEQAEQLELEVVAITDHNTISPLEELRAINENTAVQLLYGLEWTTFYGHLLTLGYEELTYTDWRSIGPTDLERGLANIHRNGAIAGIAHPFRIGNPLGTGCHWEFMMNHLDAIDFIEVWNGSDPNNRYYNKMAFDFWTTLLNKGYTISATSGRDWHHNQEEQLALAYTYVHVDEASIVNQASFRETFITAIRNGALTVSYGPPLLLEATVAGTIYSIGDCIQASGESIEVRAWSERWLRDDQAIQLELVSNKGRLAVEKNTFSLTFSGMYQDLKWIRAELYEQAKQQSKLIAFTNPIYFTNSFNSYNKSIN